MASRRASRARPHGCQLDRCFLACFHMLPEFERPRHSTYARLSSGGSRGLQTLSVDFSGFRLPWPTWPLRRLTSSMPMTRTGGRWRFCRPYCTARLTMLATLFQFSANCFAVPFQLSSRASVATAWDSPSHSGPRFGPRNVFHAYSTARAIHSPGAVAQLEGQVERPDPATPAAVPGHALSGIVAGTHCNATAAVPGDRCRPPRCLRSPPPWLPGGLSIPVVFCSEFRRALHSTFEPWGRCAAVYKMCRSLKRFGGSRFDWTLSTHTTQLG
jgi:hypothetical protein